MHLSTSNYLKCLVLQSNVGTWTTEQLMIATGIQPPSGVGTQGGPRLPPPVSTDIWIAEHPVPMQSSYEDVLGGEPSFTSCHGKFIGTVDFVWYTPEVRGPPPHPRQN